MLSKCFKSELLMTNISMFLNPDEIASFLSCNKDTRKALCPSTNSVINKIFYDYVAKNFFCGEEDYFTENKEESKRKNILENSWKSNINWEQFITKITRHFKNYPDKKISQKVFNTNKFPLYLQDLRKENINLEYWDSTAHVCYCYDKKYREQCYDNYYGNYINENYISKKGNGNDIRILKEGLSFEDDLKEFYKVFNSVQESEINKQIINYIISFDFEKMDEIYEKILNNEINNINNIVYFILWLTRGLILYCMYIYESIIRFKDDKDAKKILNEFVSKSSNYVNSCLLLNSNFENVNIIVNYLNHFIIKKDCEKFSIYDLSRKIFRKKVYDQMNDEILKKTAFIFKLLLKDEIDNKEEKEKNQKMDLEDEEEDFNTSYTSKDVDVDADDEDIEELSFDFKKEKTLKEIFENVMKSICDLVINKNNANAINHSKIILDDIYTQYENNLINTLVEVLKEYLSEGKDIRELFDVVEKLLKFERNSRSLRINPYSLKVINRTKEKLIKESHNLLIGEQFIRTMKDFSERLQPNMNGRTLNIAYNELLNKKTYNCDFSDLSRDQIMSIERKVQNEINNLKTCLYQNNINGYSVDETNKLVNEYIENDGIEVVLLMKRMIYFYYREFQICEDKNQRVYEILTHKNNENMISSLNDAINYK